MTAWVCKHVGHWGSGLLQPLSGSVDSLLLTLVPVLVYLLSGMWSYVRLNLSEGTCPSVTWASGQHSKRTNVHTDSHTDKQLNDTAFLVSHTLYPNCAQIKKHNPVYLPLSFMTYTHAPCTCVCWGLSSQCPDACTFMTNNQALWSHKKDKGPLSLRILNTHAEWKHTHLRHC